jgi:hypothetical protein
MNKKDAEFGAGKTHAEVADFVQQLRRRFFESGPDVEPQGDLDRWLRNFQFWDRWQKDQQETEWKTFNIDLPIDFLQMLDREAEARGVTRQSMVKFILYEWLRNIHLARQVALLHQGSFKSQTAVRESEDESQETNDGVPETSERRRQRRRGREF